jgi:hypothetical protein
MLTLAPVALLAFVTCGIVFSRQESFAPQVAIALGVVLAVTFVIAAAMVALGKRWFWVLFFVVSVYGYSTYFMIDTMNHEFNKATLESSLIALFVGLVTGCIVGLIPSGIAMLIGWVRAGRT